MPRRSGCRRSSTRRACGVVVLRLRRSGFIARCCCKSPAASAPSDGRGMIILAIDEDEEGVTRNLTARLTKTKQTAPMRDRM